MKRWLMLAAAVGAFVAYLFDPQMGKRRRAMARQRLGGLARRSARKTGRVARHVASDTYGVTQRIAHRKPENADADDVTIAQRIKSDVLHGGAFGRLSVNVENGCAVLRGALDTPGLIDIVEKRVGKVAGVREVRNLVHLPSTEDQVR